MSCHESQKIIRQNDDWKLKKNHVCYRITHYEKEEITNLILFISFYWY